MSNAPPDYVSIETLAARLEVSALSITGFVAEGILPAPDKRGLFSWPEVDARLQTFNTADFRPPKHQPIPPYETRQLVETGETREVVYFIGERRPYVKIGTTKNLKKRLAGLQTSWPFPLFVYGAIDGGRDVETWFHDQFFPLQMNGEWFVMSGSVRQWMIEVAKWIKK